MIASPTIYSTTKQLLTCFYTRRTMNQNEYLEPLLLPYNFEQLPMILRIPTLATSLDEMRCIMIDE